jgi:hypothetical protein
MTMIIKFLPYSPASRPPELSVIGYWARVKPQKGEVGSDLSFSSDLCSPSSISRPSITSKSTRKSKIKDRFNALTLHRFNVFGRLSHSFLWLRFASLRTIRHSSAAWRKLYAVIGHSSFLMALSCERRLRVDQTASQNRPLVESWALSVGR